MQLKFLSLSLLVSGSLAAPIENSLLATQDTSLIKRAYTDLGTAYKVLQSAFSELNYSNGRPVSASRVPPSHQQIIDLFRQTGQVLFRQPQLGLVEAAGLVGPATELARNIEAALTVVVMAKPIVARTNERDAVSQMLSVQFTENAAWVNGILALFPRSEKAAASRVSDEVNAAYKKAMTAYAR
ncbi:hypothetical protein BT63DRAFT_421505 [Microthyrium microscopicum]|uniref:Uncharacterized protein n=1 Tax=Microthyrium microscopicum TaxID=703497 RepID=A0A6A6UPJ6_9PEZI|nr:hypothetical protein BT63DRAFT_421505 [Microthyrium microscopicum]